MVGVGFDNTYPLPAGSWLPIGHAVDHKGFKYKDSHLVNGPMKNAQVKAGKLVKATGKGAGLGHTLASDPSPVDVVLTIGTRKYCMHFGGLETFKPGKQFTAKDAPTSPGCP